MKRYDRDITNQLQLKRPVAAIYIYIYIQQLCEYLNNNTDRAQ